MGKAARLVSITLATVSLTFLILGLSTYSFLRSSPGSKYILGKVVKGLESSSGHYKVEFDEGSVDPFASVHFKNLKVTQAVAGGNRCELWVSALDVRFSLSLWARRLDIENFTMDHPSLLMHMQAKGNRVAPIADSSASFGLKNWVDHPPFKITVRDLSLKDLSLNLDYQSSTSRLRTLVHSLQLQLKGRLLPLDSSLSGSFELGRAGRVFLAQNEGPNTLELQGIPSGSGQLAGAIHLVDGNWIYELNSTQVGIGVKSVELKETGSNGYWRKVSFADAVFRADLGLHAKTKALLDVDQSSVEALEFHTQLIASRGNSETSGGNLPTSKSMLKSLAMKLDATLSQQIDVQLHLDASDAWSSLYSLRPTALNIFSEAKINRDLSGFHGKLRSSIGTIPFLEADFKDLKSSSPHTGSARGIEMYAVATPDPKLGKFLTSTANLRELGRVTGRGEYLGDWNGSGKFGLDVSQKNATGAFFKFEPLRVRGELSRRDKFFEFSAIAEETELRAGTAMMQNLKLNLKGDTSEGLSHFDSDFVTKISGLGRWNAQSHFTLQPKSDHGYQGEGSTTITQLEAAGAAGLQINRPVGFSHAVELGQAEGNFELRAKIPALRLARVGSARDTDLFVRLRTPNYHLGQDWDGSLTLRQGAVIFDQALIKRASPMAGLSLILTASVKNRNQFVLKDFSAEFNHSMIALKAVAVGDLKKKDLQTQGMLSVMLPNGFTLIEGDSIQGRLEFPWTLSFLHGQEIDLQGAVNITDLAWSKGILGAVDHVHAAKVSGSIPISEKLLWDGKRLRFAHLITQNPFERVDYERLRPLITGTEQVRVEQVGVDDKTYGPLVGVFSISQNMLLAHQFDLSLGPTGRAYGEVYFDAYPANLQLGLLARLTAINLGDVLPGRYISRLPTVGKNLSARSGLVINFNRATVDGRIDVTEIGRSQLLTLINVMDPKYRDDKMNKVRSALSIGYPTFVGLVFQQGYLDLGVDLVVLGLKQREDVRGVPVSTWVQSATSGYVKKSKEGFLR